MPFPLVIADIGGTSSRWSLLNAGAEAVPLGPFPGFNPAVGDPAPMVERLQAELPPALRTTTVRVHIYGAGCGDPARRERMRTALAPIWAPEQLDVESDLLGAARALYGKGAGLVLILGTGMNVGYFDGTTLECPMPSLGFVLGDEGSGADIGKHLLHALFHHTLPQELKPLLFPEQPTVADAVREVQRGASPQAWLARWTAKAAEQLEHPWVRELVDDRFNLLAGLVERHFPEAQRREVRAVGSVALGLQDALGPVLAAHGMRLSMVLSDPMPQLVAYHRHSGE